MNPYLDLPNAGETCCAYARCPHEGVWTTETGYSLCEEHADQWLRQGADEVSEAAE